MKYKCNDCGEVFMASWDVRCPKCGCTRSEVIYEYRKPNTTVGTGQK